MNTELELAKEVLRSKGITSGPGKELSVAAQILAEAVIRITEENNARAEMIREMNEKCEILEKRIKEAEVVIQECADRFKKYGDGFNREKLCKDYLLKYGTKCD